MPATSEARWPWLWQAAMAIAVVAIFDTIKLAPQALISAALVLVAVVQRAAPAAPAVYVVRTLVLAGSTWLGVAIAVGTAAMAATSPKKHPDMPIGEVFVAMIAATVATLVVLWFRRRRPAWTEDVDVPRGSVEPRLALVVDLFALAAVLRAALDHA